MRVKKVKVSALESEIEIVSSKSGGPGGQHVNKTNTKITLRVDILRSKVLNQDQKNLLLEKLGSRISKEGVLIVSAGNKRSQLQNKEVALKKLDKLLAKAFAVRKKRKATKPGKAAKQKRLTKKKHQAEKKKWRQKPM